MAPHTVAIYWRNLRPVFAWWARETVQPNPFAGADVPSAELNPPDVIHLDDVRALLETCKGRDFADRRDNAIIRVLFDTGCRRGELAGLTVDDWDRRQDFLTLRGKTGMRLCPSRRRPARPSPATSALARAILPPLRPTPLAAKGPSVTPASANLARRCGQAGLPRLNPHAFRHTFTHEFRAEGGSEGDLRYLAAWKTTRCQPVKHIGKAIRVLWTRAVITLGYTAVLSIDTRCPSL